MPANFALVSSLSPDVEGPKLITEGEPGQPAPIMAIFVSLMACFLSFTKF